MKRILTLLGILVLCGSVLAIANPASVYCSKMGYQWKIETDSAGGQRGLCLVNGQWMDEWTVYCNSPEASASYCPRTQCQQQGGKCYLLNWICTTPLIKDIFCGTRCPDGYTQAPYTCFSKSEICCIPKIKTINKPICDAIGSKSEGWYDSITRELIRWDFCRGCEPICKAEQRPCPIGVACIQVLSQHWYDCNGKEIGWGITGDCPTTTTTTTIHCPGLPITQLCPNCVGDIQKCLCPMDKDENGCGRWRCDLCPTTTTTTTIPLNCNSNEEPISFIGGNYCIPQNLVDAVIRILKTLGRQI